MTTKAYRLRVLAMPVDALKENPDEASSDEANDD